MKNSSFIEYLIEKHSFLFLLGIVFITLDIIIAIASIGTGKTGSMVFAILGIILFSMMFLAFYCQYKYDNL